MTFTGDPYATLGLVRGASLGEVKRAYRALAKRYHPDSAGDAATPRFLAIQAAYEAITGPSTPRSGGSARTPASGAPPARPFAADTERARATREAYRSRRAWDGAGG
ncbi:MAG: J domain-containing protein, partial [Chloroflexi bacterium]|nr:J domain-containing protein [Chloroflexota bacterium]